MNNAIYSWQRKMLSQIFISIVTCGLFQAFSVPVANAESTFVLKPSMQIFTSATQQKIAESRLNEDNAIFALEDRIASLDLRPSLKLDEGQFQLIARPQLRTALSSHVLAEERQTEHAKSTSKWLEAFANWNASDKVLVSYGVQNYQWGAAETVNPSNRINHETIDSKGVLQATQGRNLMRLNVTWFKNLSSVFLAETEPVKESSIFQAEEEFESKSVMKHEVSWNSGADYLGLVYGAAETTSPWVGEYFNVSLFDGLTFYGDASHQRGSQAWYPVDETSLLAPSSKVVQLKQSKKDDTKVYTFGVAGLRYSFEGGSDIRFEYVLNNAGWNSDESDLGLKAIDRTNPLQVPTLKEAATRWLRPGLEYRGQKYGLVSWRGPDFLSVKDLTLYLRYLQSIQDRSASGYSSVEYNFSGSATFFATALLSRGEADQELRGLIASNATLGIRQDF